MPSELPKPAVISAAIKTQEPKEEVKDPDTLTVEDIKESIRMIEKGVSLKEEHFMSRAVRGINTIRPKLNHNVLRTLVNLYYPRDLQFRSAFMEFLPEVMETDVVKSSNKQKIIKQNNFVPEVEAFLHLLLVIYLIDQKFFEEATKCSTLLMDLLASNNRRTMAIIAGKCFFYHSRAHELVGRLQEIRGLLHARLRTATLNNQDETKADLINLLLYNYLHFHLYDQAYKLISRVSFPDSAPNNKWARYLYYFGRIKAIQLDYTSAHDHLVSALRKAPQQSATGFKECLLKLNTVVELLLGDMPDRSNFRDENFKEALQPYFQLTEAIVAGDLTQFNGVIHEHGAKFCKDQTYSLIVRLRHNVIKTAVRRISLSYSRITLAEVAQKLPLDSARDAEYVVAKAIRDGVIDAVIDHANGWMTTNETLNLYNTKEPSDQLQQRIKFCLTVHHQAVKAMRYPPKQYNKDLETPEERREREQQELECAKEMSEDDFGDMI